MNNPTFLLLHAENTNEWQDSICHLILVPVINGNQQEPQEFSLILKLHFNSYSPA